MELPRGMKDFEKLESSKIEYVRQKFIETCKIFGYELMEPSPIELLSVLEAKSGSSIKDEIYYFRNLPTIISQKTKHYRLSCIVLFKPFICLLSLLFTHRQKPIYGLIRLAVL